METIFQFIDVAESAAGQTNVLPELEGVTEIWFYFKEGMCKGETLQRKGCCCIFQGLDVTFSEWEPETEGRGHCPAGALGLDTFQQ